jgi:hypothetical protein
MKRGKKIKLLVTGAGRTGTWFITHALRHYGVEANHELAFNHLEHGSKDWTCEVSWLAAPFVEKIKNAIVVHVVRDPLTAIPSRYYWGTFHTNKIEGKIYDPRPKGIWSMRMIPEISLGRDPMEKSTLHWYYWNKLITKPSKLVKIEDLNDEEMWSWLDLAEIEYKKIPYHGNKKENSAQPKSTLNIHNIPILKEEVISLANKFGYTYYSF